MIAFLMLFLAIPSGKMSGAQERLEVPKAASVKEAEKLIKDIFKNEYAKKTPEDRRTLGRKLLQQAGETKEDPTSLYVLLQEARTLAIDSGDVDTAVRAATDLGRIFDLKTLELRSATLAALTQTVRTPEDQSACAIHFMSLADEATRLLDHATAEKALSAGMTLAKAAKNVSMVSRIDARTKQLSSQKAKVAAVKKAQETLAKNVDDPEANGVVGSFTCFVLDDWAMGLPLLARGPKSPSRDAAMLEAASPTESAGQAAVGDAWWTVAESAPEEYRKTIRRRASTWYAKARGGLAGLLRAKIDKRMAEAPLPELPAPPGTDAASLEAWKPTSPISLAVSKSTLKEAVAQLSLESDYTISLGDADPSLRVTFKGEGSGFIQMLDGLCRAAGVDYTWDETGIRLIKEKPRDAATSGIGPFFLSGRVVRSADGKQTSLWLGMDWEPRVQPVWYEIVVDEVLGGSGDKLVARQPDYQSGVIRNSNLSSRSRPRSARESRRDYHRDLLALEPPPPPGMKLGAVRGRVDVYMPLKWGLARFDKATAQATTMADSHSLALSLFKPKAAEDLWIVGFNLQMAAVPAEKRFALYGATLLARGQVTSATGRTFIGELRGNSGGSGNGTRESFTSGQRSFAIPGMPSTEEPKSVTFELITDVWVRSYPFELREIPYPSR